MIRQTGSGDIPSDFPARWRTSRPPFRPAPQVSAAIASLLPDHDAAAPILLLGVTPELAVVPRFTLAVERNVRMIEAAWPGDSAERRVIHADWRQMPLPASSVAGAIGDGALSGLVYPEEYGPLFDQLRRIVRPGGRVILRCFTTPDQPETAEEVRDAALGGAIPFHIFKLRFNMAVARELGGANVRSGPLFHRFQELFPDREALARASGWSLTQIGEIDSYEADQDNHCYPSRSELAAVLPGHAVRFVETHGYPLAERCPLMVVQF